MHYIEFHTVTILLLKTTAWIVLSRPVRYIEFCPVTILLYCSLTSLEPTLMYDNNAANKINDWIGNMDEALPWHTISSLTHYIMIWPKYFIFIEQRLASLDDNIIFLVKNLVCPNRRKSHFNYNLTNNAITKQARKRHVWTIIFIMVNFTTQMEATYARQR